MNLFNISFNTTKEYFKAQVILWVINCVLFSIGFAILKLPLPLLLGILFAALEILPVLGSGLILVPWAIICFIINNNHLGLGLIIVYVVIVILRQILEPIIVGKKIGLNPIITLVAMIIGVIIFPPWGIILGPIVAAIIQAVLRQRQKAQADYIDISKKSN